MNKIILGVLVALLLVACNVAPKGPSPKPFPTLPIEEMTLEQARQIANFPILEPGYLPAGLRLRRVLYYPSTYFLMEYSSSDSESQSEGLGFVSIVERAYHEVPMPPGASPLGPTPLLPNHPTEVTETVMIRGALAIVHRSYAPPAWVTPARGNREYIALEWHTNDMSFILTGSQSLQELVKTAESLK